VAAVILVGKMNLFRNIWRAAPFSSN